VSDAWRGHAGFFTLVRRGACPGSGNSSTLILEKITEMGRRLESFPHYRMTGRAEFRLRVGDYRVIYDFDTKKNEIYLITLGNRREVYR